MRWNLIYFVHTGRKNSLIAVEFQNAKNSFVRYINFAFAFAQFELTLAWIGTLTCETLPGR